MKLEESSCIVELFYCLLFLFDCSLSVSNFCQL